MLFWTVNRRQISARMSSSGVCELRHPGVLTAGLVCTMVAIFVSLAHLNQREPRGDTGQARLHHRHPDDAYTYPHTRGQESKVMASTLGVLDVLSRLREDAERAFTALAAQEDTNRSLLQRCIEAKNDSGRTDAAKEALLHQRAQLEQERRLAEARRQEAESRLKRLQKQQQRRQQEAERERVAMNAAAGEAVESSKKFCVDAAESLRKIGELRARLREKSAELDSITSEKHEIDEEIKVKKAARDKIRAELTSRADAVASACSDIEKADRVNESKLAEAKRVEAEIEEIRQAQDEMQEMALGLQRKNAILRNELRHLRRQADGHTSRQNSETTSHNHDRSSRRPSSARAGNRSSERVGTRTGPFHGGHFYHQSAAPRQSEDRATATPQAEDAPSQLQHRRNTSSSSDATASLSASGSKGGRGARAPFAMAAAVMSMPELRLSSPHPGSRAGSQRKSAPVKSSGEGRGSDGKGRERLSRNAMSVATEEGGDFEYHA